MKKKLKAIWKIIRCQGFYVATARRGGVWNSVYEFDTRDARTIIQSLSRMIADDEDSEDFLSNVKSIINQHDTK